MTHTATRLLDVEAAGTANYLPRAPHGGLQAFHSPLPSSRALPAVPRSLPSISQPLDPCRTNAPDGCAPPAGGPKLSSALQLSWATGELSNVAPPLVVWGMK